MVQLDGVFQFVSEENHVEYLKSLGFDEAKAKEIVNSANGLEIKPISGETLTMLYGKKEVKFLLGKELEHILPTGHTVWTTTNVNGDTITFKTKLTADGSLSEEKVLKVTDAGITSTSTNTKGAKYVSHYKRV